ncbi:MAG: hypothetical protein JWP44_4057 [Mucilaginibacter sp.]|nr:hypothetical protein [Mucilaginibacter sp.]
MDMCGGRGGLAGMLTDTPLHPSQEENRTGLCFSIFRL